MPWKCRGVRKDGNADNQHPEDLVVGKFCLKCGLSEDEADSNLPSSARFPIVKLLIGLLLAATFAGLSFVLVSWFLQGRQLYYKSARYGIGLNYPKSWELREPQEDYPPDVIAATKDLFQILAPETGQGGYRENILVKIEQVADPPYLDEYADKQAARIRQIGTYTVDSDQKIRLGGNDVRELIYSGDNGEYDLKIRRIIAEPKLPGSHFILITYMADRVDYDTFFLEADKVLKEVDLLE